MCFIACYYSSDIPCEMDDVEEIYMNALVLVILPVAIARSTMLVVSMSRYT